MATDLSSLLEMFKVGPTAAEKSQAKDFAIGRMGLGILAANKSGPVLQVGRPSLGNIIGQGGLAGMDAYQNQLRFLQDERKAGGLAALQAMQIKKMMDQQAALGRLGSMAFPQQGTQPPAPVIEPSLGGPVTVAAVGNNTPIPRPVDAPPPPAQGGYQPIPISELAKAAAGGVNIEPWLKLNNEARPDVMEVRMGDKIRLIDKKTMRIIEEHPIGAAPGSVPFDMKDLTPEQARAEEIRRRQAGASQNITNVNSYLPASEAAQRDFMDKTSKNYDALRAAPVVLQNISRAKEIATSGNPFIGSFGTQKAAIAQFFNNNLGTSIAPESIADVGELKNRLFQQIMDNLKKMDAQPSQLQQQLMMDALGNLNTDPKALTKILSVTEEIVRGKVSSHNKEVKDAEARGVKFPFNPAIELPAAETPKPMSAMPPANQHRGKVIEDSNGKRYKSDGMKWQPIQ